MAYYCAIPKKIFLIELTPSIPSLGRSIVMPRSGLLTIGSILSEKTNFDITFLFEPYSGKIDINRIIDSNPSYILINGLTTSAIDNELFITDLRKQSPKPLIVIAGGEHATMFPEQTMQYADYVLLYEGDTSIVQLLEAIEETDNFKIANIPGIFYKDTSGNIRKNLTISRNTKIDYRYNYNIMPGSKNCVDKFPIAQLPLQTSRGCLHLCSFCSWTSLFGKSGYYIRPVNDVVYDIEHSMSHTGINKFMVGDNLFAGNVAYTEKLLKTIVSVFQTKGIKPEFTVLCRADQFVGNKKFFSDSFLELMRTAGITHVSLGFESVNENTLKQMHKKSNVSLYYNAANRLNNYGFNIAGTFVAGYGQDTFEDVLNIANFAKKINCFTIQIYCQAIIPNTPDERESTFLKIPNTPFKYSNGHTVQIFPRNMLPSILQKVVFDAAMLFYSDSSPQKRLIGRVYQQIWRGILPYYEALQKLENEILVPEKIYVPDRINNYILNTDYLQQLVKQQENYSAFCDKCYNIFNSINTENLSHQKNIDECVSVKV